MYITPNSEILGLVDSYVTAKGLRKQANGFIDLIEVSQYKYLLSDKALNGLNKLKNCGQIQRRRMPDGCIREYIIKCHHPSCHKCDDYDRIQVAMDMLDKVRALFTNEIIIRNQVSWVTINFGKSELGSDLNSIHKKAKSDIDTFLKRKLPSVAFVGHFQIAIQKFDGMLHAHFIAVHPSIDRIKLKKTLRSKFPKCTDTYVSNFFENQTIDFAVCVAAWYASDLTTRKITFGINTPDVYSRYLNSLESIRSGGRRGYRFDPGYRRLLEVKIKLLDNEKELRRSTFISRLSLIRSRIIDSQDVDKCLENPCIQGELGTSNFPNVLSMIEHYTSQLIKFGEKIATLLAIATKKAVKDASVQITRLLLSPLFRPHKRE